MQLFTQIREVYQAFTAAITEQSRVDQLNVDRSKMLFSYCISIFSVMSMFTAVVVNRIMLFASTTRRKQLPYISRTFLRLVAMYFLIRASYGICVCLKLYYPSTIVNYILGSSYFNFDPAEFKQKSFLGMYYCTKLIAAPNATEEAVTDIDKQGKALRAVVSLSSAVSSMIGNPKSTEKLPDALVGPSTSILRPLFLAMCINQIILAFISITGGDRPCRDNSLTLFEYSIAFQETQGLSSRPSFELLVLCIFEVFRQLLKHTFSIFNLFDYRLACSTVIEMTFMAFFGRVLATGRMFYLPVFVVFGYMPFVICALVFIFSLLIYVIAGLFKGSFEDLSMTSLIKNFSAINISASDDFYTALTMVSSFTMRNAIGKGYLYEKSSISIPRGTYLETANGKLSKLVNSGYGKKLEAIDNGEGKYTGKNSWVIANRFKRMGMLLVEFVQFLGIPVRSVGNKKDVKEESHKTARNLSKATDIDKLPEAHIENLTESELSKEYAHILLETEIESDDDSQDYVPKKYEDVTDINDPSQFNEEEQNYQLENHAFTDLVDVKEFCSLVRPRNADDFIESRIMEYHLQNINRPASALTRSSFLNYYSDDLKLIDLIRERRLQEKEKSQSLEKNQDTGKSEDDINELGTCVICHVNSRQIILWPCKCFAICDRCRISLYMRNFKTCVCCRSKVESYSKVYVP
ncbi:hypothetical protein BRETT_001797 [Brettanomyces bruxellensis]|uniref:Protein ASI1 n=1 Tax=Dekkera bruxellensis TaxID=5007 RepID=A0A871R035_DEKBR|nr:uncharacterized protein BRETT_001797 [Brettanomyces bruxellensis]QOU18729.1 hypothetical protein BRETT_001797 [Brettanomyces bruxellensis]